MPFTRDGLWTPPTDKDVETFRAGLANTTGERKVNIPPDVLRQMAESVEARPSSFGKNQIESIRSIGKLKGPADLVMPVYGGVYVLKEWIKSILYRTQLAHYLFL